jgi:hypothetical protein
MATSPLQGSSRPEGTSMSEFSELAGIVGMALLFFGGLLGGLRLEWKYKAPYTLKKASSRQKWQWAVNIGLFRTLMWLPIPIVILASSENFQQAWQNFSIILGIVFAILLLTILLKRWGLELALECYHEWNKMVKSSGRHKSKSLILRWPPWYVTHILRLRKMKPYVLPHPHRWASRCWKWYFFSLWMGPMPIDDKERRRFWLAGYPPERESQQESPHTSSEPTLTG